MKKIQKLVHYINAILTKEQKKYGVLLLFLSFIGATFELLGVSIIVPMVTLLMNAESLLSNSYIQKASDLLHINDFSGIVILIGAGTIGIYVIKNIFFVFLSWVRAKYSCKIQRELSVEMMSSYMKHGYSYFLRHNTGDLLRGVSGDTGSVYLVIANGLKLMVDILTIALICIFMLISNSQLAFVVIILALLCIFLIYKVFRKNMQKSGLLFRKYSALSNQALLHALEGIKDVIILDKRQFFVEEYNKNMISQQKENVKRTAGSEYPSYVVEGICVSGLLAMACVMALNMDNTSSMVTTLAAFAMGAFRILPSLGRISSSINAIIYALPSIQEVYQNIEEARKINLSEEQILLDNAHRKSDFQFNRCLELRNLCFAYEGKNDNVLEHVNLAIQKGETIGLIGQSGAGKTTLTDIVLGLLKPQSGQILVDDIDVSLLQGKWNNMVGYVPQSVYLADNTIRFNVAFGMQKAFIDESLVWETLDQAQLKEFVESLPEGLDTYVGDRGVRFSGGQRQRIAIARALYHKPQILVLDEATAALDTETEEAVMQSIEKLRGTITMVIVAHRLTTLRNCDVIYEIKEGKAVVRDKEEILS